MTLFTSPRRLMLLGTLAVASVALFLAGCSKDQGNPLAPTTDAGAMKGGAELSMANPAIRARAAVQDRHTADLMAIPGVVGTATGVDENGELGIMVMTEHALGAGRLPTELEGVRVFEEVTGKIRAFAVDHKVKQTPPIQMGTSGGWRYDLANGYCCGGTLGSLVLKGGNRYVMSNYHVLEADIVSGGNSRVATAGDPVVQPGLIDVSCNAAWAARSYNRSSAPRPRTSPHCLASRACLAPTWMSPSPRSRPAWCRRTARSSKSARSAPRRRLPRWVRR